MDPSDSRQKLFPRLLAGIHIQLHQSATGSSNKKAEESSWIKSTVFLCIDDKSMNILVEDQSRTLLSINPIAVQYAETLAKPEESLHVIRLHYGHDFVPSVIEFVVHPAWLASDLKSDFECVKKYALQCTYEQLLDYQLSWEFQALKKKKSQDKVSRDALIQLMKSISGHITSKDVKHYMTDNKVTIKDFAAIYRALLNLHQSEALTEVFNKSLLGGDRKHGLMGFQSLKSFLVKVQQEDLTDSHIQQLMSRHRKRKLYNGLKNEESRWTFQDFVNYLHSIDNDVLDPTIEQVKDMNSSPISNYFINSSHNSYLTGNQLNSKSSADVYGKLLRKGVRCLEIDMWDGVNGQPIVTHGNTLCTKIPLIDVVQAIGNNAFEGNSSPVILSLEDHCNLEQQATAAYIFKSVLGDKLLVEPPQGTSSSTALPTPQQLLGKIILKHKKLAEAEAAAEGASSPGSRCSDGGGGGNESTSLATCFTNEFKPFSVKIGPNGHWQQVKMFLYNNQLEMTTEDVSEKSPRETDYDTFWVTQDAITFWHKGTKYHWPIETNKWVLPPSYSLSEDPVEFASLSALITFYQLNALPIHPHCKLGSVALAEKDLFRLQQWYLPHLNEQQTIKHFQGNNASCSNGAFIVRSFENELYLSFFMDDQVFNVDIDEGLTLTVGGVRICLKTIYDLVEHFERVPFYGDLQLCNDPLSRCNRQSLQKDRRGLEDKLKPLKGHQLNLTDLTLKDLKTCIDLKNAKLELTDDCLLKLSAKEIDEIYFSPRDHLDWLLDAMWKNNENLQQLKSPSSATTELPRRSTNRKVSREMSDLVVYCVPKAFTLAQVFSQVQEDSSRMTSFNESRARNLMVDKHQQKFQVYHQRYFSRVYPNGTRADSSNYDPMPFWLSGAQMVCLNFQTAAKELQVNSAWFLRNGNSGYVLKPECLTQEGGFNPNDPVWRDKSIHLTIGILSGRHLSSSIKKGAELNTLVKLEVMGCPIDCCYGMTGKICYQNSFNPVWNETFCMGLIHYPALAVLRISAYHQNSKKKTNELLCQATLPLDYLRQGYRSVRMRNAFGDVENPLSVLLIHVKISSKETSSQNEHKLRPLIENFKTLLRKPKSQLSEEESREMKDHEDKIAEMLAKKRVSHGIASTSVWYHSTDNLRSLHADFKRRISSEKFSQ